jgi:serine/threonine protein kinase
MIDIVSLYIELASLSKIEQEKRLLPLKRAYPAAAIELEKMLLVDDIPLSSSQLLSQQISNQNPMDQNTFIGQQVMGFTITQLVSESGGMGLVFQGEQRLVSHDCESEKVHKAAVKILRTNKLNSGQQKAIFFNEASILIALDHPNVCSIYGVSEVQGHACIVMDYIDGLGLDSWIANNNVSQNERLNVFDQLMRAVSYLHHEQFFHGDIKPQNIIINEQGHLVLIDLGLASKYQASASEKSHDTIQAFTRYWSAPEQVLGQKCTAQSDVFSLGVILHYLLTDKVATKMDVDKLNNTELNAIIKKTLSIRPEHRYSNAEALRKSIRYYQQGLPVQEFSQSGPYLFQKLLKRKPFTSLACVLLVYSVATSLWIIFN